MVRKLKMRSKLRYRKRKSKGKASAVPRAPRSGGLVMLRKMQETILQNTGVGTVGLLGGPAAPTLTLGTPSSTGVSAFYNVPFTLKFQLNQLVNSTDITNLCDKYRIAAAYVRIFNTQAAFTPATAGGAVANSPSATPAIEHFVDHDDSNPVGAVAIKERMGTKYSTFRSKDSFIMIKCYPKPVIESTSTTGVGNIVPRRAPYINSAQPNVEHYGIKGVIHNMWLPATAEGTSHLRFDVALKIQAKDFQ